MQVVIVAVGKLRSYYRDACDDYLRRLRRYARVEEREVRETSAPARAVGQRRDDAALLERVPDGTTLVALTRGGSPWTSQELARRLERWRGAARPLTLVIGGSHGLGPGLLEQAGTRWSLGPLTLPHELARVVVVEQVYRAFTILAGERYHKGGER
jgi:23S rRNA (pseudouridine1915-N3)-methyltransferase